MEGNVDNSIIDREVLRLSNHIAEKKRELCLDKLPDVKQVFDEYCILSQEKSRSSVVAQWVQAKHMDAFTVLLYQRLTYSFNTDRDSFSTFPALSDGVRERILALLVNSQKWERFQKVEDYKAINQTITYELPGLLYYLMNEYTPPERCIWSSFGCRE